MKFPRLKFTFFYRQFLSHFLLVILIVAFVSIGFRYYIKNDIYNMKTKELISYASVITRTIQKNEENAANHGAASPSQPGVTPGGGGIPTATPQQAGGGSTPTATPQPDVAFQSAMSERKISYVLMNKNGDVLSRDQRTLSQEYKSKSFLQSLKAHIPEIVPSSGSFRIEKETPDPLLVLPRPVKLKSQTAYLFVMSPEQGLNESLRPVNRTVLLLLLSALLLAFGVSLLLSRSMSRIVHKLRDATQRIATGTYSASVNTKRTDELGDLARDLNSMADQLEAASSKLEQYEMNRRQFITDVTHELRTPLTSIRGIIEGLKNDFVTEPAEQKRYYAIIEKETFRLIRLINELLDLERIGSGNITLKYGEYSLHELLEVACESLGVLVEEKNLRLLIDCPETVLFYGDYDRIMQIVINLVKNSIQFIEFGTIRLIGTSTDAYTVIEIIDTGKGISAADLPHIWERFYKSDPSRTKERSETGLGLSIVKHLVEAHRGEIAVTSELGIGTTFMIRLPKP
jgi:signal transduction histidine kinase